MNCRICESQNVSKIGDVEYYSGFARPVFDCDECKARFTWHDPDVYDALHKDESSRYNEFRDYAAQCQKLFNDRNVAELRNFLRKSPKSRFVIDEIEKHPRNRKLLEIGCSRGYLTSYFILAGYEVCGVDVSSEAINAARKAFGEHFFSTKSFSLTANGPYDAIYHQGTIGCVGDPLGLIQKLLDLLTPGGLMVFNSPNVEACWLHGQLWIDTAPPPDLVTLFRRGFWQKYFSDTADVVEEVDFCSPRKTLELCLLRFFRRCWRHPSPVPLLAGEHAFGPSAGFKPSILYRGFRKARGILLDGATYLGLGSLVPSLPAEFGLYVRMVKR